MFPRWRVAARRDGGRPDVLVGGCREEGVALLTRVLPQRVETEALTRKYGKFVLEPLERGFGITVGNALRRVLLSALEGAAVTTLRIGDIHHEFSPIPGVREDTTELILNVKRLRFRLDGEGPARCHLEVREAGVVTAADIQCPPEVQIMNPDQYLFTAETDEVDLDIEFVVEKGRGYWPAEERKGLAIGEIPVDALFSPVIKAAYNVESTRIGHSSDYDRLIVEVWTDGSILPDEALRQAARILVDHFAIVAQMEAEILPAAEEEEELWEGIPQSVYETPLEELDLSVRSYNCLKRAGISKVGEVLERLRTNEQDLLNIRNFGRKSLQELKTKLDEKGFLVYIQEPAT